MQHTGLLILLESKTSMKRKPDLMWILVIILSLGVVTTGYTQSLRERSVYPTTPPGDQAQTMLLPHTTADQ
jgi:hypothetical protein